MGNHELADRLYERDERALEEIVTPYTPYVYAVIDRTLGGFFSTYDKEPLVFDVFFSLWWYRGRIANEKMRSFLGVAAHNRAAYFLRYRTREIPTDPDAFPGNTFRVESVWETVERRLYMEESLAILDQRTRELFSRRYILDETVEEA